MKWHLIYKFIKPLCKFDHIQVERLRKHLTYETTHKEILDDLRDFYSQLEDNLPRARKLYGTRLLNDLKQLNN